MAIIYEKARNLMLYKYGKVMFQKQQLSDGLMAP